MAFRSPVQYVRWIGNLLSPKLGRGAQIEFQAPTPIRAIVPFNPQDGALSATGTGTATLVGFGDAPMALSATGTGVASFVGSYSFNGLAQYRTFEQGGKQNLGRGAQLEFQTPLPIRAPAQVTLDGALSATGTGVATFAGFGDAPMALSATGTAVALFVGTYTFDGIVLYRSFEQGAKQTLGRGPQVEFQTPLPLRQPAAAVTSDSVLSTTGTGVATFIGESTADSSLSATGTGAALFTGASTADSSLSATGTGTATFVGASSADASLSATGTGVATFTGASFADAVFASTGTGTATWTAASTADAAFSMTGTGTALFIGAATSDSVLSATGTATVSWSFANEGSGALSTTGTGDATFTAAADSDAVLSATGTATVAFAAAADADGALATTGTATASFVGDFDGAAIVTPPPVVTAGGAGGFPGAWGKPRRRRRKKEALDELGELLVAVSQQVAPWTKAKAYEAEQALYRDVLERGRRLDESDTLARIEAEIANVRELLAEIDDEEAMMFLLT